MASLTNIIDVKMSEHAARHGPHFKIKHGFDDVSDILAWSMQA